MIAEHHNLRNAVRQRLSIAKRIDKLAGDKLIHSSCTDKSEQGDKDPEENLKNKVKSADGKDSMSGSDNSLQVTKIKTGDSSFKSHPIDKDPENSHPRIEAKSGSDICRDCGALKKYHKEYYDGSYPANCKKFEPEKVGCGILIERGAFTYKCGEKNKRGSQMKLCKKCSGEGK